MSKLIRCPYCCEEIPSSSTVCPYCGEPLTPSAGEGADGTSVSVAENESETDSNANVSSSKNLSGWSEMSDMGKMAVVIISIVMILSIVIAITLSVASRTRSYADDISSEYSSSGSSSTTSKTSTESSPQLFTDSETGLKYVYFDETFGKGVATALNFPDISFSFYLKTDSELIIYTDKYQIFWPQFTDALVSKLQNTYSKYQFYAESGQYTLRDEVYRTDSGRFISKANNEVCDIVMDIQSSTYPSINLYVYLSSTDTPFDVMTLSGFQDCKLLFNVFKTLTNNLDSARRFFNSGSASSNSSSSGTGASSTVSAESLKSKKVRSGLSEGRTVDLENMTLSIYDEDLGALTISEDDIIPFGELCRKWLGGSVYTSFTLETKEDCFALWRIGADNVFAHTLTMGSWQPNFAGADVIYELIINDEAGYEDVNMSFTEGDLRAIISVIFD